MTSTDVRRPPSGAELASRLSAQLIDFVSVVPTPCSAHLVLPTASRGISALLQALEHETPRAASKLRAAVVDGLTAGGPGPNPPLSLAEVRLDAGEPEYRGYLRVTILSSDRFQSLLGSSVKDSNNVRCVTVEAMNNALEVDRLGLAERNWYTAYVGHLANSLTQEDSISG